jgi:L-galactose dehydrogenase
MEDSDRQSMRYRKLGRTDLEVSILGFGASPLGDVFSVTDPVESKLAVHYAIERGINFFDVSPYYGVTLAEQRLGVALDGLRHHPTVAATLVGMSTVNQVEENLRALEPGDDQGVIEEIVAALGPNFNYVWPSGRDQQAGLNAAGGT